MIKFNQSVGNHYWQFIWHLDGTGTNDRVMEEFVKELEDILLEVKIINEPVNFDETGKPIDFCKVTSISSKFVFKLEDELSNKFYNIMYMKKS